MAVLGNVMEGIGIAILLITLYFAYSMYKSINYLPTLPAIPSNMTINKSIGSLVNGLLASSNSFIVLLLKIFLLFLFASIGYKFVALGINMNKAATATKSEKQTEKEGMNKY